MKTSAAGNHYSNENSIASRIHASKVDPKAPNFKVLSCHSVVNIIEIHFIIADTIGLL